MSQEFPPQRPQPRASIMQIEAYVPGKSAAPAGVKVYKLSSNETPLGPSPKAKAAFATQVGKLELYPDGSSRRLRESIANRYGLNPDHIICGAGSDELLTLLTQTFLSQGEEAIFTEHGFLVYKINILAVGGIAVVATETGLHTDVNAILRHVTPKTRMVFVANPNNPTGTYLPHDEIKRLATSLPKNVLLVLDAAYSEYVRRNDYTSGIELVSEFENVVMTRTFSKIYGLANLRLGWCYAPAAICDAINRIRGPFNVNGPALEAGIAAMADNDHLQKAIAFNEEWLDYLTRHIRDLGIEVTPSVGNFLLLHFPSTGPHSAEAAESFLTQRGLILRAVGAYGLPHCLRLSVGTAEANQLLVKALKDFLRDQER